MERWKGKVAVVTGASSGIGEGIVRQLVAEKMIVVGLARRKDRLEQLKKELNEGDGEFHYHTCDVADVNSIKSAFAFIKETLGRVHVMITCAGIIKSPALLEEGHEEELSALINTNLMGSVFCIKEAYTLMKPTGEECHIISINSYYGYRIPFRNIPGHNYNLYPASKFAMKAAMEVLRLELAPDRNFRITDISPGLVKTEIAHANGSPFADQIMNSKGIMQPEELARIVKFVLEMPKHVQIVELIVTPTGQKF